MAFVSGKGGTGKSTTAVMVGGQLAKLGQRVLLIELAAGMRSVDIISGVGEQTVFDISDVLTGRCSPEKATVSSPLYPGLQVICGPVSYWPLPQKQLEMLCAYYKDTFDFILLDVAPGFGADLQVVSACSDCACLVTTPDMAALRQARETTGYFSQKGKQMRLILNKVNRDLVASDRMINNLDYAIDLVGEQLLGIIPDSFNILGAVTKGVLLTQEDNCETIYQAIAARILGQQIPLIFK